MTNEQFFSLVQSIVIALVTAYVTVRLSLKQFYSQRWWEKKAEAYSAIIHSLYQMKAYVEKFRDTIEVGSDFKGDLRTRLESKAKKRSIGRKQLAHSKFLPKPQILLHNSDMSLRWINRKDPYLIY